MSAFEEPLPSFIRKMSTLDKPLPLTANVFYGQPLTEVSTRTKSVADSVMSSATAVLERTI